jgi:hypothetical protein
MLRLLARLLSRWPVEKAVTAACVLGIVALLIMVGGVLFGTPLWVIASMSVAQALGVLAGLLFGLSVAADAGAKAGRKP